MGISTDKGTESHSDANDLQKFKLALFDEIDREADKLTRTPRRFSSRSRYRLIQLIGKGGLGAVYRAVDRKLGRNVAVKISKSASNWTKLQEDRFFHEYRLTASLQHPGIPSVFAAGRLSNGKRFYAMRLVKGLSMSELIRTHHRLATGGATARKKSLIQLMGHFKAVCDTVHAAHENGVVHLDLKPENVMVESSGATFVVDWGLAQAFTGKRDSPAAAQIGVSDSEVTSPTSPRSSAGTPEYMAPEQLRGERFAFDRQTDVFALGGILQMLLTGSPPRIRPQRSPGRTRYFSWIRREPLVDVEVQLCELGRYHEFSELASICRRAVAESKAQRYPTAKDLREEIERWERGDDVEAHRRKYAISELVSRYIARHAKVVASAVAAVIVATAAMGIAWAVVSSKYAELDSKNTALTVTGRQLQSTNEKLVDSQQQLNESNQDLMRRNEELNQEQKRLQLALEVGFKLLRGIERENQWSIDDAYTDILQNGLKLPDGERAAMLPLYLALIDLNDADDLLKRSERNKETGFLGNVQKTADKAAAGIKLGSALANLDQSIAQHDKSGLAWLLKAQIRREILNQPPSDVLPDWNQAVALLPKSSAVFSGRGWCNLVLKDSEQAFNDFTRSAQLDDRNEFAQLGLGRLAEASGDLDGAVRHFRSAAELPMRYNTDKAWRLSAQVEASYAFWARGRSRDYSENFAGAFDDTLFAVQFGQPKDCPAVWGNLLELAQSYPVESALLASDHVRSASSYFRNRPAFDFARDVIVAVLEVRANKPNLELWTQLRERQQAEPSSASELTAEFKSKVVAWIATERVSDSIRQAVTCFLGN